MCLQPVKMAFGPLLSHRHLYKAAPPFLSLLLPHFILFSIQFIHHSILPQLRCTDDGTSSCTHSIHHHHISFFCLSTRVTGLRSARWFELRSSRLPTQRRRQHSTSSVAPLLRQGPSTRPVDHTTLPAELCAVLMTVSVY